MLKHRLATALLSFVGLSACGAEDPFSDVSGETSVSLGYGYAKNVLFSELAPVDSAFALARVEAIGDLPVGGDSLRWESMLFAERRHYFSEDGIPDQSLLLAQSEVRGFAGLYVDWRLGGRFLGMEQAFDVTFDALERSEVLVKARELEAFAGWESFFWIFAYDAEVGVSQMSFERAGNDYDSFNWQIESSYPLGESLAWEFGMSGYERTYRDRSGRDLDGNLQEGSLLGMDMLGYESGLAWSARSERAEHRVSLLWCDQDRDDSVSGYYARRRRSVEFAYRGEWERASLLLQVDFGNYRYGAQRGEDGLLQTNDSWSWLAEVDRKLSERWGVFVSFEGEVEASNLSLSSYESGSLGLGLRWLK